MEYDSNDWTYTRSILTLATPGKIVFIGVDAGERNPADFFNSRFPG